LRKSPLPHLEKGRSGGLTRVGFLFPLYKGNVIKLSIRALILEETLLKKGFFQALFPKTFKSFGKQGAPVAGV
jgi:hypothetical protein